MKKSLNITFINPNTEEQIVQAISGVLAYSLVENDEKIKFDYSNSNSFQYSHEEIEDDEHQQNHYQWIAENHAQRIGLWCCLGSKE